MYNILPDENKAKLKREYLLRLLAICCLFLSFTMLVGTILLFPSFIVLYQKRTILNEELKTEGVETPNTKNFSDIAKELQQKVKLLGSFSENSSPRGTFSGIISERGNNITLSRFTYDFKDGSNSIVIVGNAKTRDDLLRFQSNLEKTALFKSVDFPDNLLAQNKDIMFNIILHLND